MIKAIETRYNGYHFRSRLEARWAVFFDALAIPYEYEKEGFDLNGVRYLPDFWLPEQQCFVEVKGEVLKEEDRVKCLALDAALLLDALAHGKKGRDVYVYTLIGMMGRDERITKWPSLTHQCLSPYSAGSHLSEYWLVECDICGKIGFRCTNEEFSEEDVKFLFCDCYKEFEDSPLQKRTSYLLYGLNPCSDRLIAAYAAARQARFEHGEMPRVGGAK